MAVANTQAYYDTATITAVKSFTVQAPGVLTLRLNKQVSVVQLEGAPEPYLQMLD